MNSLISRTLTKTLNFRFPQIFLSYSNFSSYSPKFPPRYEDPPLQFPGMGEQDENETKRMKIWPKPSEIPFQSKVANSLNFIGTVQMPVQFVTTPDGKSWAGTYISQDSHSSSLPLLWIPIIFEGDLAHTALAHLKRLQNVYISGHLTPEPLPINLKNDRVDVQVMVHDFYFVRGYPRRKSTRDY